MRKLVALSLALSVCVVMAIVTLWSGNFSEKSQHELAINMVCPAEVTPVFVPANPESSPVPYGKPPATAVGITTKVEPHCNSPGGSV